MISHLSGFISLSIFLQVIVPAAIRLYSQLEMEAERLGQINGHDNYGEIQKFDFIIVGAGSAGSVLANRLSSSKKFRVLLIERGGEPNPLQGVPLISVGLLNNPDVDYRYHTTPQKTSCLSLNGRSSLWSRGKGIGGSSNLNLLVYIRGHPKDYSNWVNITGDKRWSYENVLPFFKKSENYCVSCEPKQSDPTFNAKYHNTNGLLSVAKPTQLPLIEKFLQAIEWVGVPRTDLNGPYTQGCAPMTMTQKKGRRSSTGSAFIDPVRNLRTLTIQKFARAYKEEKQYAYKLGTNLNFSIFYY